MEPFDEYFGEVEFDDDEDGDDDTSFLDDDDFGRVRKALIFKEDDGGRGDLDAAAVTRSYSSMRLKRSSSEVIETKASKSSVGN